MRQPVCKRAPAAAAPSSPTQLTAPLLQAYRQEQQALRPSQSDDPQASPRHNPRSAGGSSWREGAVSMLRARAAAVAEAARHLLPTGLAAAGYSTRFDAPDAESVSPSSSEGSGAGNEFLEEQFYLMNIRTDPITDARIDASDGEGRAAAAHAASGATGASASASTSTSTSTAGHAATPSDAITQFLAEPDGPHFYLNAIRGMLLWRQPTEDISRFLNDTLLSRWLSEFDDKVSQRMPSGIAKDGNITSEDIAKHEFCRLGCRLTFLELPDLPPLTDQQFTEFTDRHAQIGDGDEIERRLTQFCAEVHGR